MAAYAAVILRSRNAWGLAIALAAVTIAGCHREAEPQDTDVAFIYDIADYDMAEAAVTGQVRARLESQGVEMRDLWLGLRPVEDGPAMLNVDVDVYAGPESAEDISRFVAETSINALPKHDAVRVRVYWWQKTPGDDYAHHAGTWTWDADGNLMSHEQPISRAGTDAPE